MHYLAEAAYELVLGAEHQRMRRLQKRMFKNYLAFCAAHSITDLGASSAILAFMYSLKDTTSPRTVCNYMSALKAVMQRLGFNVHQFDGVIIKKKQKALSKAQVTRVHPKCTFTIEQIETLFRVNKALGDHYPSLRLLRWVYLLSCAFRISSPPR